LRIYIYFGFGFLAIAVTAFSYFLVGASAPEDMTSFELLDFGNHVESFTSPAPVRRGDAP